MDTKANTKKATISARIYRASENKWYDVGVIAKNISVIVKDGNTIIGETVKKPEKQGIFRKTINLLRRK